MQAAVVTAPGVLEIQDVPDPEPGPGEVLVELRTAALNRRDTYVISGAQGHPLPLVPGSDGAGIRRDTGEEVVIYPALGWGPREERPGPEFEILGGPRSGTFAELVAVPAANVYPKPRRFSWEEAAAFPLAGLTAFRALFARARLTDEDTLLILGAGSGVSTFALQLAVTAGVRAIVTSSSVDKLDRARQLGAHAGVLYTRDAWVEEVRSLTGGEGVDVVLDSVGSTWPDSLRSLRQGGRVVAFGSTGGFKAELEVRPFFLNHLSLLGTTMGSPRDFEGLLRAIDGGRWPVVIDSVRPLAELPAALARLGAGEHFGKLVLSIG